MEERYARQTMLPEIGEQGQRRLSEASVLIVGIGGLGSAAALYLTGAGVGRIGLADADTVSKSNLQRQVLYTEGQVGMPKSAAARERLAALSSHTAFECRPEGITPENARPILDGYDLILDCCDNFPTRYLLDDLCAACRKPWVHGSIGEFYGQVTVFNGRKGRRYRDLYPDRKALCARPGSRRAYSAQCRASSERCKLPRRSNTSAASASRSTGDCSRSTCVPCKPKS